MMWNWFAKMLAKNERPKRKKVLVDIPYEFHMGNLRSHRANPHLETQDMEEQDSEHQVNNK